MVPCAPAESHGILVVAVLLAGSSGGWFQTEGKVRLLVNVQDESVSHRIQQWTNELEESVAGIRRRLKPRR